MSQYIEIIDQDNGIISFPKEYYSYQWKSNHENNEKVLEVHVRTSHGMNSSTLFTKFINPKKVHEAEKIFTVPPISQIPVDQCPRCGYAIYANSKTVCGGGTGMGGYVSYNRDFQKTAIENNCGGGSNITGVFTNWKTGISFERESDNLIYITWPSGLRIGAINKKAKGIFHREDEYTITFYIKTKDIKIPSSKFNTLEEAMCKAKDYACTIFTEN